MESILWALNLVAVCLLCLWALREDDKPADTPEENSPDAARKDTANLRGGPVKSKRQSFPWK